MAANKFAPLGLVLVEYTDPEEYPESVFWPSQITQFHGYKQWRYVEYFGGTGYSGGVGHVPYFSGRAPLTSIHAYDQETKENLDKYITKEKIEGDPLLRAAVYQINQKFSEQATANSSYELNQDKTNCQCRLCCKAAARNADESCHTDDSSDEEEFKTPNTSIGELEIVSNAGDDLGKLCEIFDGVVLSERGDRASHSDEALLEEDNDDYAKYGDFNAEESSVVNQDSHTEDVLEELANADCTEIEDSNDDESGVETRDSEEVVLEQDNDEYVKDQNGNNGAIQPFPPMAPNETEDNFVKETNNNNEEKTENGTENVLSENNNDLVDLLERLDKVQIDEKSSSLRRSTRRTESQLLEEENEKIRNHLRRDDDEGLGLKVEDIPGKGRGVVTTRDLKKDEFVVEHAGKLITREAAKSMEEEYGVEEGMCCYMFYFNHQGKKLCIDETEETGRLGRLLNHSRQNPNLVTKVLELDGSPRLYMVAKKDIKAGDELVFDYGEKRKEVIAANPWLEL